MRANEIATRLADQVGSIAEYLIPSGKRDGHEWVCGSLEGEPGKSLKVRLSGDKSGVWKDFATGEGGDLLGLWQRVNNQNLREAMDDAMDYLGIRNPISETRSIPNLQVPDSTKSQPVWDYLKSRGISAETVQAYGVQATSTEVILPSYVDGKLANAKYRNIHDKKKMRVLEGGLGVLFGWQAIGDQRSVILCEGEIDALSWFQMGYPALSVPNGAQGLQWVEIDYDRMEQFDEIYIAMDADQAGQKAVPELVKRLGAERCRVVDTSPHKDANDLLMSGEDPKPYVDKAKYQDPEELKGMEAYLSAVEEFYQNGFDSGPGFNTPWEKLKGLLRFRSAELSILNGVNGHGKTNMIGHLVLSAMEQGQKVCVASMEIKPERLLYNMDRQAAGGDLTIPKIRAVHNWGTKKLWLFDLVGTAKSDRLLEVFKYAHKRYGITYFVIDSLAKCGIAEDDYRAQKQFIEDLCDFKNTTDCHVTLVTHSRKGDSEDTPSNKMDVKGTGAITDLADTLLTLWRNKPKERALQEDDFENDEKRNECICLPDAQLIVGKQRNGDWEGKANLWFDPKTHQYKPEVGASVRSYINVRAVS